MLREVRRCDLGTATITPTNPVVAGSRQTWTLTFVAGKKGLQSGGSIRVTIPHGFTTPQLDEFYQDGFVTANCSKDGVELSMELVTKIFCAYRPELRHSGAFGKSLFVHLEKGELLEGESVEIIYGDTSYYGGESWGPKPPRSPQLSRSFEFTVGVDSDGSGSAPVTGYYLLAQSPTVEIVPASLDSLIPVICSHTHPGDDLELQIIGIDRFANPIEKENSVVSVCIDGKVGNRETVDGRVTVPVPETAVCFVNCSVSLVENHRISGSSNPAKLGPYLGKYNLYWGDIHSHSVFSDGLGLPEELLTFARDVAQLDFAAITDHDDIGPYLSSEEWRATRTAITEFNAPGRFVTFLGYEYRSGLADMNVYFPGDDGTVMCGKEERWDHPSKLNPQLAELGGMIIPHQHFGADWRGLDPNIYRVMEIYSQHGCSEYPGCPREIPYLRRQLQKSSLGNKNATFQEVLAMGAKLGATAGSDSHSGRPGLSNWTRVTRTYRGGLTAVFAAEKTREDIWQALVQRHCYATTGPRIYLEFSINGHPMGSEIRARDRELSIFCIGVNSLSAIEVIRNNETIHSKSVSSHHCDFTLTDTPQQSEDYYYVRVTQTDGEMAWSSPVWVAR